MNTIGIILSLFAALLVAEIVPAAKRGSRELFDLSTLNPLSLLKKGHKIRQLDYSIRMEQEKDDDRAKAVVCAFHNNDSPGQILFLKADTLHFEKGELNAQNILMLHFPKHENPSYTFSMDTLDEAIIPTSAIEIFVRQHLPPFDEPYFAWNKLLEGPFWQNPDRIIEIVRRISLALAPLTFTHLGFFLSIHFERRVRISSIIFLIGLAFCAVISFLIGKNDALPLHLSILFYLAPHLMIWATTARRVHSLEQGRETTL